MNIQTKITIFNICGIIAMVLYFVYEDVSWLVWSLFMYVGANHNEVIKRMDDERNTRVAGQGSSTEQ